MTTSPQHPDAPAQAEVPGMTLQTDQAKATAAEITADNAALEEAFQEAEAQAEATEEQASHVDHATADVLEELQDRT